MKKEFEISLNSVDRVKAFVTCNMKYDIDIELHSGRYIIDGKSIMGVFSLDLTKPLHAVVTSENKNDFDKLFDEYETLGFLK